MNTEKMLVEIKTPEKTLFHVFTRSITGVLDYTGAAEPRDIPADDGSYQRIESSNYFSKTWYTYLPKNLQAEISVLLPADIQNLDTNHYSFLGHIGAVLLAISENDPLLVAELIHRRPYVFANFTPIMLHILKPIAAQALFAWVYGRLNESDGFFKAYHQDLAITTGEQDVGALLFGAAREELKPNPSAEKPEDMFIRYFKNRKEQGIATELTIGTVGAGNHKWVDGFEALDKTIEKAVGNSFLTDPTAVAKQKQQFMESLAVTMQAEPYNPHDHNAIAISIEDMDAKLKGIGGKSKVGYIRATGAAILRKANPNQFGYNARLWRIGGNPSWFENAIVLKVKI